MPFDAHQWIAAVNAYHRREVGGMEAPAPTGRAVEANRHCFGCGETYLASPVVWERFPDPANPYALCCDCGRSHDRSATPVRFIGLEWRHLSRYIRDERRVQASDMARNN